MEFPMYIPLKNGFKVQVSKGMALPGIFLNIFEAERAFGKHDAKMKIAKKQGKPLSKKEK